MGEDKQVLEWERGSVGVREGECWGEGESVGVGEGGG